LDTTLHENPIAQHFMMQEQLCAKREARSQEMGVLVRNTFVDYEITISELLPMDERCRLLHTCGARRAQTLRSDSLCSLADSLASSDLSDEADSDAVQPVPSLYSMETMCPKASDAGMDIEWAAGTGIEKTRGQLAIQDKLEDCGDSITHYRSVRAVRGEWSKGAELHEAGQCKPCAFLDHKKGCFKGGECEYCHLCSKGMKKFRQLQKRRWLRNAAAGAEALLASQERTE